MEISRTTCRRSGPVTQDQHLVLNSYLKSGRVNFILPCSVAIFSASGTASSHLERTHSFSHLRRDQPISSEHGLAVQMDATDSPEADFRIGTSVETINLLHLLHMSQRERVLQDQQENSQNARVAGLWWTSASTGRPYLMKQQGQKLDELVGGQSLHVGLAEAVQVLVSGLKQWRELRRMLHESRRGSGAELTLVHL